MAGTVRAARGRRGLAAANAAFTAGRPLPVLILAARGDETALAERPHGLRLLRLLAASSLVLALVAGVAHASTTIAKPAGDPSVTGTDLVWMQPGVGGYLLRGGQRTPLPRQDPTLRDALLARHAGDT